MKPGTLYVVATPIGNLEDISARALRTLQTVPLIAAEDTRHSGRLLRHYAIPTRLVAYHDHNEAEQAAALLAHLQAGRDLALISDAGTPGIADPGYRLVRLCREHELPVVTIPGPCALAAALSISGLPTDRFAFEGFLPAKARARREALVLLAGERRTLIFYESPHRLGKTLQDMTAAFGPEREVAVARELTKLYEELLRGPVAEMAERFTREPVRGEVVLLVAPAPAPAAGTETVREALLRWRRTTDLSWKEIVRRVAAETGTPGSEVYREHLEVKREEG